MLQQCYYVMATSSQPLQKSVLTVKCIHADFRINAIQYC